MAPEVHGRGESARQDRSGQGDLGMDPLLLEHGQPAPVAVARHDPVRAVVGEPALGRLDVDAHAGQAPGRGGADRDRTRRPHPGRSRRTWRWRVSTCRRRRRPPRGAPGPRRRGSGPGCRARRGCRPTPPRSCARSRSLLARCPRPSAPGSPPDALVSDPHTTAGRSAGGADGPAGAGNFCRSRCTPPRPSSWSWPSSPPAWSRWSRR